MNSAVYLVLHFITVRTVWYILFFISWQFERCGIFSFSFYNIFERCGIFCFSFHDSSNVVVYLIFHFMTVRTVRIFSFSFYTCSNSVVYFVFHLMTFQTVWDILFFIWRQFERCGIFCFSFDDSSNGVVYFVFHFMTVRTVRYI